MANGLNKISLTVGGTFRKGKQVTQKMFPCFKPPF